MTVNGVTVIPILLPLSAKKKTAADHLVILSLKDAEGLAAQILESIAAVKACSWYKKYSK